MGESSRNKPHVDRLALCPGCGHVFDPETGNLAPGLEDVVVENVTEKERCRDCAEREVWPNG